MKPAQKSAMLAVIERAIEEHESAATYAIVPALEAAHAAIQLDRTDLATEIIQQNAATITRIASEQRLALLSTNIKLSDLMLVDFEEDKSC